jgi:hypothetical protein
MKGVWILRKLLHIHHGKLQHQGHGGCGDCGQNICCGQSACMEVKAFEMVMDNLTGAEFKVNLVNI